MVFVAHGSVATPWNGMTIPRRCALPCTPKTTHSARPTAGLRLKCCQLRREQPGYSRTVCSSAPAENYVDEMATLEDRIQVAS